METKFCRGCDKTLSVEKFGFRIKHGKKAVRARCRRCDAEAANAYRRLNRETVLAQRRASRQRPNAKGQARYWARRCFFRRLGYDPDQVFELMQDAVCWICGKTPVVPDHDHQTGQLRGLLCAGCNLGIGKFADDPSRLRRAAEYLETITPFATEVQVAFLGKGLVPKKRRVSATNP